MQNKMISAIIATRNRSQDLRCAIRSLVTQTLSQDLFEIIIVDNGSQDDTRQVVEEFSSVSNLSYIYEPVTGLSRARNTGVHNAQGQYFAFLDDDAIANPDWLAKYLEAFEAFEPGVGSIGGKIEILTETSIPRWLSEKLLVVLSVHHYSDQPVILNENQWVSSCNVAYPKAVFETIGGLREDLGRKGANLMTVEDLDLRRRLDARGLKSIYHPDIIVGHRISSIRFTKKWFRKAAYWQGRSAAIMLRPNGKPLALPVKLSATLKRMAWTMPRLLLVLLTFDPAARFYRQFQVIVSAGYFSGLWMVHQDRS